MATKTLANEREYVIPLRSEWMKVARYKRTARGVKAIKAFIAKHMRVPDRDTDKVKLDVYLNNEIWFRGGKKPPSKIKVKAVRDGDVIRVELVNVPEMIKFAKARHEKKHKKFEKKKVEAPKEGKKEGLEEKVEEKKEDEETKEEGKEKEEKEKSVEQANIKIAEQAAKAQKHTAKGGPTGQRAQRKALKK